MNILIDIQISLWHSLAEYLTAELKNCNLIFFKNGIDDRFFIMKNDDLELMTNKLKVDFFIISTRYSKNEIERFNFKSIQEKHGKKSSKFLIDRCCEGCDIMYSLELEENVIPITIDNYKNIKKLIEN